MQTNKKTELGRVVRFTLFSASAGLIEMGAFAALSALTAWSYWPRYLIALVLSVLWNFTLNRKFTFCSAGNVPLAMLQVAGFYAVFTPLSTWWTAVLTGPSVGWNEYLVLIGTMLINFVSEYLFDRLVVFRRSIDTAKPRG